MAMASGDCADAPICVIAQSMCLEYSSRENSAAANFSEKPCHALPFVVHSMEGLDINYMSR